MSESEDCPFCSRVEEAEELLLQGTSLTAFYDKYPVNDGHALLVPNQHLTSLDEFFRLVGPRFVPALQKLCRYIREQHQPAGLNVGFNEGEAAGQTIEHVHCHVIPRYHDDVPDPTGGIRGVIPDRRTY